MTPTHPNAGRFRTRAYAALTIAAHRASGMAIDRVYRDLVSREYWSSGDWSRYQTELLRRFLVHCYEFVPYYRDTFDRLRIKPDDIRGPEDLSLLPVLTKEDVRREGKRLIASNRRPSHLIPIHTTGSTGTPLKFYGDRERRTYVSAGLWRVYSRCGWWPGERLAIVWGFREGDYRRSAIGRWARDTFSRTLHFNAFKANDAEFGAWLAALKRSRPTVLTCYASSGARFASWLIDRGEHLHFLKGVYCTSERLLPHQARLMSQAFGCGVFDLYGCGEVTHVACTCERGRMHQYPDMAIVEFGERTELGSRPFILTGLRNWAMPFVRYTNGDCGLPMEERCECGRVTPQLELGISRMADVFRFRDGKQYPSLYFILRLYRDGFDGVELFQFHQDRLDHVFLRVVRNSRFSEATHRELIKVKQEIEAHIEGQAEIEVLFVEDIPQTSSAKHLYARSDVAAAE